MYGNQAANRLAKKLIQKKQLSRHAASAALFFFSDKNYQDCIEEFEAALQTCERFIQAERDKYPNISHDDKVILKLCYLGLSKFYTDKANYPKVRENFLAASKIYFDLAKEEGVNVGLLDCVINFGKASIHLARYHDNVPSAEYYQQVINLCEKILPDALHLKIEDRIAEIYVLLGIAYSYNNKHKKSLTYLEIILDNVKKSGYEPLKTSLLIDFITVLYRTSYQLLQEGKYTSAIQIGSLILPIASLYLQTVPDSDRLQVLIYEINFRYHLLFARAYLGLADLAMANQSYCAALEIHTQVYRSAQVTKLHQVEYPFQLTADRFVATIFHLSTLEFYAVEQYGTTITARQYDDLFAHYIKDFLQHVNEKIPDESNALNSIAEKLDEYLMLVRDWPDNQEIKRDFYQAALTISKALSNQEQIAYYEDLLNNLTSCKPHTSDLMLDLTTLKKEPTAPKAKSNPHVEKSRIPKRVSNFQPRNVTIASLKNDYHQVALLEAYRLYQQEKYLEGIAYYKKLREKASPRNRLFSMQCLTGLGECYSARAEQLEQTGAVNKEQIEKFRGKALQVYQEALRFLNIENEEMSDAEYVEMQRLGDFICQLIDCIHQNEFVSQSVQSAKVMQQPKKLHTKIKPTKTNAVKSNTNLPLSKPKSSQVAEASGKRTSPCLHNIQLTLTEQMQGPLVIKQELGVSVAAQRVKDALRHEGYGAYLVGGAVRDPLLKLSPADYDIVTNATPEQVAALFPSNSKIIGNCFTLVLIQLEQETIEVATLRKQAGKLPKAKAWQDNSTSGSYGFSLREDAFERDFSINALYYFDGKIIDHVGGYRDLKNKMVRALGDVNQRFQRDPVLMLRGIRLAAKLDFALDTTTSQMLMEQAKLLLSQVNPARLYREVCKTFLQPYDKVLEIAQQHGILKILFPLIDNYLIIHPDKKEPLAKLLTAIGNRYKSDNLAGHILLFACLLWLPLKQQIMQSNNVLENIDKLIDEQSKIFNIPDHVCTKIKAIWLIYIGNQQPLSNLGGAELKQSDFNLQQVFAELIQNDFQLTPAGTCFANSL
jgi:poly(A) polymerase